MSGFQEWFTAAELASLALPGLPASKRGLQFHAERESWENRLGSEGQALVRPRKGRGGGVEYSFNLLPEAARARLVAAKPARTFDPQESREVARESAWARYERLPQSLKDEARRRLDAVQRVESLERAGLGKSRAVDEVTAQAAREARAAGHKPPFSAGTLYAWFKRICGAAPADRLAFLAPDYVGRTATADCDEDAWLLFRSEFLTNSRQSAAAAHRKVAAVGAQNGWNVPSCRAMTARLERELDPVTLVYLREGEPGLARRFPTPKRDVSALQVLQVVNVDGHELDVMVKWADGTVGRPMMVAIQDVYSRRMLVTQIGRSESVDLVRRAFAQLFQHHGVPEHVVFDNGRSFASKYLTGGNPTRFRFKIKAEDPIGLLGQLGCQVHFTTPYWGRAKPIERAFGDFADGFARSAVFTGAYTGRSTQHKPADYGSRAAPIADFMSELEFYTRLHNAQLGRKTQMAGGRLSFDQVWEEALTQGHLVRRATPAQVRLALLAAEGVTVRRQTCQIHLAGNIYWSEELFALEGEKVTVRFDTEDLHAPVHVYRLDGAYVCEAACVEAIGFFNGEAAKEVAKAKSKLRKAAKGLEGAQRLLDARQVAGLRPDLPEPEFDGAEILAPVFGALARKPQPRAKEELSQAQVLEMHARAAGRLRLVEQ